MKINNVMPNFEKMSIKQGISLLHSKLSNMAKRIVHKNVDIKCT